MHTTLQSLRRTALVGALVLALPAAASAQANIQLGIAGGAVVPTGDLADFSETGFNVHGFVGMRPMMSPVGLRFILGYTAAGATDTGADFNDIHGAVDATLAFAGGATAGTMTPYILGGLGFHSWKFDVAGFDRESDLGINGGGGIRFNLAGMATMIEARYVWINADPAITYVPITVGIAF